MTGRVPTLRLSRREARSTPRESPLPGPAGLLGPGKGSGDAGQELLIPFAPALPPRVERIGRILEKGDQPSLRGPEAGFVTALRRLRQASKLLLRQFERDRFHVAAVGETTGP